MSLRCCVDLTGFISPGVIDNGGGVRELFKGNHVFFSPDLFQVILLNIQAGFIKRFQNRPINHSTGARHKKPV